MAKKNTQQVIENTPLRIKGSLARAISLLAPHQRKMDAICFSCNGSIKRRDNVAAEAVLGRGTGRWAKGKYTGLATSLAELMLNNDKDERVYQLKYASLPYTVVGLKTKDQWQDTHPRTTNIGDNVRKCLQRLVQLTNHKGWKTVVIPVIGTGSAKLDPETVNTMINEELDDRFVVIEYEETDFPEIEI